MGVNVKGANIKTKNVAAVTVTANLPAFARQGSRIDIHVSTIGDAKSLEGGTLLATPLVGADGDVYAVGQGAIAIGGFKAMGADGKAGPGSVISKGVATSGFISSGAIVEKEINFDLSSLRKMNMSLINPDISTAVDIARIINDRMGDSIAKARDPATISLEIPDYYDNDVVGLLAKIENIEVKPDSVAKVIIEESSGTIVIGENVRISPVAIAQGNLTITIKQNDKVEQPDPFAPNAATTMVILDQNVNVDEDRGRMMHVLDGGTTLKQLVDGLNSLGVTPRDLITILQNIKAAGALQAEIEAR
jgi:flagellar P-ring protein precursor FlgI